MKLENYYIPALSDKNTLHSYLPAYNVILESLLAKNPTPRILEIGIQRGGSLLMWKHAVPTAEVFGLDIDPPSAVLKDVPVVCIQGDAYSEKAIAFFHDRGFEFDFIVEDGSHTPEHILWAASHYPKLLRKGGVMVIEDIPSQECLDTLKATYPEGNVIDLRSVKGRYDDILFSISR